MSSSNSPSNSPNSNSTSLIMRDFEIEMLKEKIKFMQSQINEKDTQLEYYRGLAQTLQDLLMNRKAPITPIPVNQISNSSSSSSAGDSEELNSRQFTPLRNSKKSVSFHEDVKVHYIPQDSTSSSI